MTNNENPKREGRKERNKRGGVRQKGERERERECGRWKARERQKRRQAEKGSLKQ